MPNPFDWDYLTTQPASGDVLDGFTIAYATLFAMGFIVSAYLYYRPWTKPIGRMFRRRAVIQASGIAMWVFGVGLFFFLIRLLQINPFSLGEPIWMWLCVLAVIIMFAMIGMRWNSERHAQQLAASATDARGRTVAPHTAAQTKRPVRRDRASR